MRLCSNYVKVVYLTVLHILIPSIASDGFDYSYEYALIDQENNRIIYMHLSYPDYSKLQEYKDFLKINSKEYDLENVTVLDHYTIYAHKFEGLEGWIEYSDMK